MEQKNLISKEVDSQDTRYKEIRLTEKAVKLEKEITNYFISSEQETEKILGSDTKKKLLANLAKLDSALSDNKKH